MEIDVIGSSQDLKVEVSRVCYDRCGHLGSLWVGLVI